MNSVDKPTIDLATFAGTWVLDPERTSVTFRTKAMWMVPVKGTAKAFSGEAKVTPDGAVTGSFVIDPASIHTKNAKRDRHLRSEDFFDVAKYPTIVFEVTGGRPFGPNLVEISGTLTVHGQTRPITLKAEVTRPDHSAKVSIEVEIDRSRWGISWAKMGTGLKNQVAINAHFDRT